jgi:hypothetical protein
MRFIGAKDDDDGAFESLQKFIHHIGRAFIGEGGFQGPGAFQDQDAGTGMA